MVVLCRIFLALHFKEASSERLGCYTRCHVRYNSFSRGYSST